jgi:hypothetical protein
VTINEHIAVIGLLLAFFARMRYHAWLFNMLILMHSRRTG